MLRSVDLHLEPNEASDLVEVHEPELLSGHGWDRTYLTVLDEGRVERCIALLAHEAGASIHEGWSSHRLRFKSAEAKTDDAEVVTVHDGRVYVLGSHYGSKDGPLQPKRHFVARFAQSDLGALLEGDKQRLELVRTEFRLHRAVNEALRAAPVELFEPADRVRGALIAETIRRGERKKKDWRRYLRYVDLPINIEGAAFTGDGTLLLGLRFPVTRDGHPVIVALHDVDALFGDPDATPGCGDVWWLEDAGSAEVPAGIRALDATGGGFQAICGSLDSVGKDSVLVAEHPEAATAGCTHWRFAHLPAGGGPVPARLVHDFGELRRVEGVADGPDGHALYVVDEESRVDMRFLAID